MWGALALLCSGCGGCGGCGGCASRSSPGTAAETPTGPSSAIAQSAAPDVAPVVGAARAPKPAVAPSGLSAAAAFVAPERANRVPASLIVVRLPDGGMLSADGAVRAFEGAQQEPTYGVPRMMPTVMYPDSPLPPELPPNVGGVKVPSVMPTYENRPVDPASPRR